jgi:hypothetical protein
MKTNKKTIIERLEGNGFNVRVTHYRYVGVKVDRNMPLLGDGDIEVGVVNVTGVARISKNPLPKWAVNKALNALADSDLQVDPLGGITSVEIFDGGSNKIAAKGFSYCCDGDLFNRKDGFDRAVNRALVNLALAPTE